MSIFVIENWNLGAHGLKKPSSKTGKKLLNSLIISQNRHLH